MNTVRPLEEAKQVCPTTTRRLIQEGALLVDVREPNEVARLAFDVPAIVNIPLSALEQRWSELPKDRELVLVCEVGSRSLKATYYLQYQGFTQVSNMEGGIQKWVRKGFPVIGDANEALAVMERAPGGCCGESTPASGAQASACCDNTATRSSPRAASACCGGSTPAANPLASACCAPAMEAA